MPPSLACRSLANVALMVITARGMITPRSLHAQQTAPAPCADSTYRQFDFWLGDWEVRDPKGALAGHNHITRILGGCVVHESWTDTDSSRGESFNIYDRATGRWHQTWVDQHGLLLELEGGLQHGAMVLEGRRRTPNGQLMLHRVTWTSLDARTVRQLWQQSGDDGRSWQTVFDGTYHRERGH